MLIYVVKNERQILLLSLFGCDLTQILLQQPKCKLRKFFIKIIQAVFLQDLLGYESFKSGPKRSQSSLDATPHL